MLCGFPVKEYYLCNENGDCKWVAGDLLEYYIKAGWNINNGEHRMSYAVPEWLPRETNPNGTILFLDDFTRCIPMFMQAVMEIIDKQEYVSWKLPELTTVVLSGNTENGDYNVSSIDPAQKTRYIEFEMKFDVNSWAKYAENARLANAGINFALCYPELFEEKNHIQKVTARSYTAFVNAISGLNDWGDPKNLAFILQLANGCFTDDEDNVVGSMFTMFINNKLDKLISPDDMLNKPFKQVENEMEKLVYDKGGYRVDIASVLATRFLNYSDMYFKTDGAKSDVVNDRILEFFNSDKKLFSEDLIFHIFNSLLRKHGARMSKLVKVDEFRKKVIM